MSLFCQVFENWLLKSICLRPSLPDIFIFQASPWWDTCSYEASCVRSGALGTALCSCIGEMFIAAKSQKPWTLCSSQLIPPVKLLQVHFIVSLVGIRRRVCQKQNQTNTPTHRHNPHCSTVAGKMMRYIAFFGVFFGLVWFSFSCFFPFWTQWSRVVYRDKRLSQRWKLSHLYQGANA